MPLTTLDFHTALIVIDLQKGVVSVPSVHPMDGIVKRAAALAEAFRRSGRPASREIIALLGEDRSDG